VYFISKQEDVADFDKPLESLVPKNDGAKADAAESIESKTIPIFIVAF